MKVLIALDESPVSIRAAREAVRLFSVSAPDFLVINVATLPTPWVGATGFGQVAPLAMDPQWLDDVEKSRSHDDEAELMALAADAGVPNPDVVLRAGDAVSDRMTRRPCGGWLTPRSQPASSAIPTAQSSW